MARSSEAERALRRSSAPDRVALFGVLWAVAHLLHLLAVGSAGPSWARALVAVAAGLALCWPGAVGPLALLAAGGVLTAWYEAPDLPDSWALVAIVDAGILVSVLVGMARRRAGDRADLAERLFPGARLCLLGSFAFAGFAKLNEAFLDRRVSCAVVRFRETTSSIGLESLQLDGAAWLERGVIVATVAVELAVPVLLVVRRTRLLGLGLALAYHAALGLDRHTPFFDGAATVLALLTLFLPAAGAWAAERVGSVRARIALRGPRLPLWVRLVLAGLPMLLGLLVAFDGLSLDTGRDLGWWGWHAVLVVAVVSLVRLLRQGPAVSRVRLVPHHALFALAPLLVVLNGIAPYAELKTAAVWTTWSNLRTVGGEPNHLIASGAPSLSGPASDVVRIVDSDDPTLGAYRSRAVGLTWRELRSYLSEHPDVAVTYVRDGRRVALAAARERPDLVEPVPTWQEKLLAFRPVDLIEPERCLVEPGPSR